MAERAVPAAADPPLHLLQGLIWPEQGICTERDLYVRLEGPAGFSEDGPRIDFAPGGVARFDTWCNLFNIGKWVRHCGLGDIRLALRGAGRFELAVTFAIPDRSWERLANRVITLEEGTPFTVDLSHFADHGDMGVLFFELRALSEGRLDGADWQSAQAPRRVPELALSVTTFRREAQVARTVARFERFIAESPLKKHIRLIVVDNGQSAGIEPSEHVTPLPNANLGGAGGFARGLLEARVGGATHCLFMDDDAATHMENVERTWTFLAHATDPATAVAGALTSGAHRWALWENGAVFDRLCLPRYKWLDLRNPDAFLPMEFETTGPAPDKLYGGWWYFAFPVAHARHMPFPFFVRGDDVSFGLAHAFNIVTLPGVACFQDADFSGKESPLTFYLDTRCHLAHHLSLPRMEIGPLRTAKIAAWFFARTGLLMHYEALSAVNLAVEDVLRGPGFFAENADMAERRARIRALTRTEAWAPLEGSPPPDRRRINPHRLLPRLLMKIMLNGHLLPFFGLIGNRITLGSADRGNVRATWGAARITYLDARGRNAYTVRHSKARFLREGLRMTRNILRLLLGYRRLRADWRQGYDRLTTEAFWMEALDLAQDGAPAGGTGAVASGTAERATA